MLLAASPNYCLYLDRIAPHFLSRFPIRILTMTTDILDHDAQALKVCESPLDLDMAKHGTLDLVGSAIEFSDGSCWKLVKALTRTKYQQGDPPFEARQVFDTICIRDKENRHHGRTKAIIKVKYQ